MSRRPNILFLLTDNQRDDLLGCAGHPILSTPNMDRLAAVGVRFANAFVTTPICAASRASIFTGLYERLHRFSFHTPPLRKQFTDISYPALLKRAGYRTGMIGKFGLTKKDEPNLEDAGAVQKMFDVYDNYEHWGDDQYHRRQPDGTQRHLTDITADKVVEFLGGCRAGQPWCLSVSFNAPHSQDHVPDPYIYPPSAEGLYEGVTIPEPINAEPEFFDALPEFIRCSESRRRWTEKFTPRQVYQRNMRDLFRMITGVDITMGRIFAELDALGMADNTVVIFMSDNGMFYGDRGLSDCWLLHEQSIRVPLIVCDPREGQSQRDVVLDEMALNVDVAPTILDLAGLDVPRQIQGRSLLSLVHGQDVPWRTETFLEHLFDPPEQLRIPKSEGVRTDRWKYICYFEQSPPYEELYDLSADPNESINLAGRSEHAATLDEMRRRCDHWTEALAPPARTTTTV